MPRPARIARSAEASRYAGTGAKRGLDLVQRGRISKLRQLLDVDAGVIMPLVVVGIRVPVEIPKVERGAIGPDEALVLLFPHRTKRPEQPLGPLNRRQQRDLRPAEEQALCVRPVALGVQRPIPKAGICLSATTSAAVDDLKHRTFDECLLRTRLRAPDILSSAWRAQRPIRLRSRARR